MKNEKKHHEDRGEGGMMIHRGKKALPKDTMQNYLWEYKADKWAIVINYDKIENKRMERYNGKERDIFKLENEITRGTKNVTQGAALNSLISDSLLDFPRDYALSDDSGEHPISRSTYRSRLHSVFEQNPSQNTLCKSYINHFYRMFQDNKTREKIAGRMRHSTTVAMKDYWKIDESLPCDGPLYNHADGSDKEEEEEGEKREPAPKSKKKSCDRVRGCPDIPLFNPREHAKLYRQKKDVKDRLKKWREERYGSGEEISEEQRKNREAHNRSKLVNHLNRRYDDKRRYPKPQARSIKVHNLVYDPDTESWTRS
jgi:hypothetical protein